MVKIIKKDTMFYAVYEFEDKTQLFLEYQSASPDDLRAYKNAIDEAVSAVGGTGDDSPRFTREELMRRHDADMKGLSDAALSSECIAANVIGVELRDRREYHCGEKYDVAKEIGDAEQEE